MPLRSPHSFLRRLAVALVLLGVVAQLLASQASTAHVAGMLSQRWLWGDVCSGIPGGGPGSALADFDRQASEADGDPAHVLSHCPVCALALLPPLAPLVAPDAAPVPVAEGAHPLPAPPQSPRASPADLLPPSQGPPAVA